MGLLGRAIGLIHKAVSRTPGHHTRLLHRFVMETMESRVQFSAPVPSTECIWTDANLPQRIVSMDRPRVSAWSSARLWCNR